MRTKNGKSQIFLQPGSLQEIKLFKKVFLIIIISYRTEFEDIFVPMTHKANDK